MNKLVKSVLSLPLLFGLMFAAGCNMGGDLGNLVGGNQNGSDQGNGGLDEVTQLNQIYELAKAQGYEGTYEEWLDSLKGDQIELRISQDGKYIQWRYSSSSSWQNLIPLSDISGENGQDGKDGLDGKDGQDGEDGLTPHVGENGNWWIGNEDTGISAHGKGDAGEDGKDGQDGLTPYIGKNGNWWIGDSDTKVKAEGKGDKGDTGKSAYEVFMEAHPEYQGDESQWLEDLLNGKLSESNYKYYDVKFNLDGGEFPTIDFDLEQEVLATHAVECPTENPTKPGFIFAGWYVGNTKWNFDSNVVLKNLVIKARWVHANVDPRVEINNVTSDYDSIFFDLYVDNISEVDTIALYRYGELVQTLDNLDVRQFDGLYSNQEYQLEVTFSYDLNDGYGRQTETTNYWVWTASKQYPMFSFEDVSATTESLSFTLNEFDPDEAAKFTSYELYLDGEKVAESTDITSTSFLDLLANKDYVLRVNYECDMNDLSQPYTNYVEYNVRTLELFAPVITLNNQFATQNAITGQIIINDTSLINTLISVQLYKGDELIETTESLDLAYTGLENNTTYTIVVVHEYDLRDGNGVVRKQTKFDVTTHPIYELTNTEILNTSAIVEGELVYIHAEVENPSNAVFTKIYINDTEYDVDPASTATHVFAYIPSVELGDTDFTVNKLIATIDGSEFEYYAEANNTATATVYNRMDIESIEFVDKDFNERNYFFPEEEKYIQFNLNNPNGYALTEVDFGDFAYTADDLIYVDDNTYYAPYNYGWENNRYVHNMTSYSYANELVSRKTQTSYRCENLYILSSDCDKTYISSVDELLSISDNFDDYRYYELTNDIDLSGMEWTPINVRGVLNGNGHSIKNMRIAKTYENSSVKVGLISYLQGVVSNLTMDSMIIMAEIINQPDDTSYISGIVGYCSDNSVIDNCHILNNSSISVQNINSNHSSVHIGCLTAGGNYLNVKNSSNRANLSVKGDASEVGMLAGYGWRSTFENSFNTGNLIYLNKGENIFVSSSDIYSIKNCYNTGALNGNYEVRNVYNNANSVISLGSQYPNQVLDMETIRTYTFETNGGNELEALEGVVVTLPTPKKEGYYFWGWYDNEDLTGEPVKSTYYNKESVTLYAKWGTIVGFDDPCISNDETHPFEFRDGVLTSTIHERDEEQYYSASARYTITADRQMRVYYKINVRNNSNGSGYITGSHNGEKWDEEEESHYIDLKPGQYLEFYVYSNDTSDETVMTVEDLVIIEM